jgi:hypothetical protein
MLFYDLGIFCSHPEGLKVHKLSPRNISFRMSSIATKLYGLFDSQDEKTSEVKIKSVMAIDLLNPIHELVSSTDV